VVFLDKGRYKNHCRAFIVLINFLSKCGCFFRRFKAKIITDVQKEGQEEMESCWPVAQYFYLSDLRVFVWFYFPIHHLV
jgi:hypothetical protein